jgi:hippurate hydrolase
MLDEGMLDVPDLPDGTPSPVSRAFALHITSSLPTGWIASRGGPALASADTLTIDVVGRGGHASEPYRTRDPIPVACEIVQALQTMVTRTVNVFEPAVVTVASISAGTTNNVIPDRARIVGTIRAVSESTRSTVHAHIKRVADGVASAHGLQVSVSIDDGYPVTVNDRDDVTRVLDVARRVAGKHQVVEMPNPVMGAEDFSYVLQRVPGSMAFLGATPLDGDPATAAPNHSTKVVFDERAMVTGIATYAAVALDTLR